MIRSGYIPEHGILQVIAATETGDAERLFICKQAARASRELTSSTMLRRLRANHKRRTVATFDGTSQLLCFCPRQFQSRPEEPTCHKAEALQKASSTSRAGICATRRRRCRNNLAGGRPGGRACRPIQSGPGSQVSLMMCSIPPPRAGPVVTST